MDQTTILQQQGTATGEGYALLIGVDDYENFPSNGLQGSCNDVRMLYWFATKVLDLPPDHIRVLVSSGRISAGFWEDGQPPSIGAATHDSILEGVQWLAGELAKSPAAPGLLTFSGHGAYSTRSLICPADVGPGPEFSKGIAVGELAKMDALQKVRKQLTVVLDCCHVVGDVPASDLRAPLSLPHAASADTVARDHESFDISDRVFLAARLGQSAYQAKLGKVFHGALTFSLVTVAEQWKATQEPGRCGMDVKNKGVLKRVRRLLWALRVKQSARLRVSSLAQRKSLRELPFFGVVGVAAAVTTRKPDAPREKIQLVPNYYYTISDNNSNVIAYVVVPNSTTNIYVSTSSTGNGTAATAGDENWYVTNNQTALANLFWSRDTSITILAIQPTTGEPGSSAANPLRCSGFTGPTTGADDPGNWTLNLASQSGGRNHTNPTFGSSGAPTAPSTASAAYVQFTVTSPNNPASQPYTLAHVQWYVVTGSTTAPSGAILQPAASGSSVTWTSSPLPTTYYGAKSF